MRVSRRLPQSAQFECVAMAARGVWQHCVRGLARNQTVAAKVVVPQPWEQCEVRNWSLGNAWHQVNLPRSSAWGEVRPCAANAESWLVARHCNAALSGGVAVDRLAVSRVASLGVRPWSSISSNCSYSQAMRCSTFSFEERNSTHTFSTENLSPSETIAAERESFVQEFVRGSGESPSTPFVQAIKSQDNTVVEDSSSWKPPDADSGFFADFPTPSKSYDADPEVEPTRVFVGGLPFSVQLETLQDGLREMCSKYGTVVEVRVAQHREQNVAAIFSGRHRGFAFVTMETAEQALEVIENLNATDAWGRIIMVSHGLRKGPRREGSPSLFERYPPVLERKKVYVGNLNESTSKSDLLSRLEQYGPIEDVRLITEQHTGRSRGFAFVTFADEGQAMRAVVDLDGSNLDGSVLRVNIAKYPQAR